MWNFWTKAALVVVVVLVVDKMTGFIGKVTGMLGLK